jgi:hypothetical protein
MARPKGMCLVIDAEIASQRNVLKEKSEKNIKFQR